MSQVDLFRSQYRQGLPPRFYHGHMHFAFTVGFSIALIILFALRLDSVSWLEWLTVPATFVYANLCEYLGHRGPMHHPRAGLRLLYKRHAGQHHRFFTHQCMAIDDHRDYYAVLFPPLLVFFFVITFTLPAYFLIRWLASENVAGLFGLTAVAYFLNYELLHFAYHQSDDSWIGRLPLLGRLKEMHQHHHNPARMAHCNFNITYPLADWLFGTYEKPNSSTLPSSPGNTD